MKVGIIQSCYIPWRGYFDFIDDVDVFIYYDDVQYTRHNWRNRNKIKTANGLIWLTVPVNFDQNNKQTIEKVKIDYQSNWIRKHIRSIEFTYSSAPYYKQYAKNFFDILNEKHHTISQLNIAVNNWIMNKLNIKTKIHLSSEFKSVGNKYERPLKILKEIGATEYLSGPTAKDYTPAVEFQKAGIKLAYKSYKYAPYPQLYGNFEPQVSILDILFNCGSNARKHLKSLIPNEQCYVE